jgi:putative transposase
LDAPEEKTLPVKPKIGIRASRPNEYWHVDTTIIRLIDGTKAYIQAVIDNYSRYILAWKVTTLLTGRGCYDLLAAAIGKSAMLSRDYIPYLICDSGIENLNQNIDQLDCDNWINRLTAQIEIDFSNSMIETFFRSLKHNYLFLQALCSIDVLTNHVDYYCGQHNKVIPHSAFRGATPEEVYLGEWRGIVERAIPIEMEAARKMRIEFNRGLERCSICSN